MRTKVEAVKPVTAQADMPIRSSEINRIVLAVRTVQKAKLIEIAPSLARKTFRPTAGRTGRFGRTVSRSASCSVRTGHLLAFITAHENAF